MRLNKLDSPFLTYLIDNQFVAGQRLPALNEISREMNMSVGKLREQLEVARSMGLVSAKPRLGIQREPFDFSKMILDGVLFGLANGEADFEQFSQLRQIVEAGFWDQAVVKLTRADKEHLLDLVAQAWVKLRGEPIHIPNGEHRDLHLTIFSRLDNPFVQGILATYWDAYEASEWTRFVRYEYWIEVWTYHERIVEALLNNNYGRGRQLLVEHFTLLKSLPMLTADPPLTQSQGFSTSKGETR
jgi:DNA-binding FadR family transcriptional regulator